MYNSSMYVKTNKYLQIAKIARLALFFFDITSRFGIIKKIKGVKYESRVEKVHLNKDKARVQNV